MLVKIPATPPDPCISFHATSEKSRQYFQVGLSIICCSANMDQIQESEPYFQVDSFVLLCPNFLLTRYSLWI